MNAQALDLSIVVHQGQPAYHLTGTDYFAPVADAALDALAPYWQQDSVAESARVPGRIPGRPDRGRGPAAARASGTGLGPGRGGGLAPTRRRWTRPCAASPHPVFTMATRRACTTTTQRASCASWCR
ncbi:hypothetical protein LP420_38960 [Massilia sp. B-10]|nr:hypothetical protein LP420_38960 [Massilia sp. B-10]